MKKIIILSALFLTILFVAQAFAGMSFLKSVIFINDKNEQQIFQQQRVYSDVDMVRVEEEASDIEGNPKVRIYDFQKKKMYTIMMNVKLYLEQEIGFEKDFVLYEVTPEKKYGERKDIKIDKTKQGEEVLEGHKLIKYEIKVTLKDEKGKDKRVLDQYNLWVADDLNQMPVRYEYSQNNGKRVISYTDIKTEPVDASLFSIPEGYKAISPF
ncbi:MAG: hypothetical protein HZA08_00910 [Nitrospirae bacterium]|nr:hypothetical protein [Nitrospirota bacterium]